MFTGVSGSQCTKTESAGMVARMITQMVPQKVCPKGASQSSKGGCTISRTIVTKEQETVEKQVNTQRVSKKAEFVSVKKPVSVPTGPNCGKGARASNGGCVVSTPVPGFELVEVARQVKVSRDDKTISEVCFSGDIKGPCVVVLEGGNQEVKDIVTEKTIQVAELKHRTRELTLKSRVKVAKQVCPQGSRPRGSSCPYTVCPGTRNPCHQRPCPRSSPCLSRC